MAETISSGEESSEEDDHDENFPSRRGPVSSTPAPLLPGLGILTRQRSCATFETTSREYRSTSDGESKKKSTKASNQVRLADCLHSLYVGCERD